MSATFARDVRTFVLANYLLGREAGFTDDSSFLDEGIIDSTGILELVSYLEETYEIEITEEELIPENLDTVNRIAAYLGRKLDSAIPPDVVQPALVSQVA